MSHRRLTRLAHILTAAWGLMVLPSGEVVNTAPPAQSRLRQDLRAIAYKAAKPIYDPAPRTTLYLSGYAKQRPAAAYAPTGYRYVATPTGYVAVPNRSTGHRLFGGR